MMKCTTILTRTSLSLLSLASLFLACGKPPSSPTNLRVAYVDSTAAELTWESPTDNISGFKIGQQRDTGGFDTVATIPSSPLTHRISNLKPATRYKFVVWAYNGKGISIAADPVACTTWTPAIDTSSRIRGDIVTTLSNRIMPKEHNEIAPPPHEMSDGDCVSGIWNLSLVNKEGDWRGTIRIDSSVGGRFSGSISFSRNAKAGGPRVSSKANGWVDGTIQGSKIEIRRHCKESAWNDTLIGTIDCLTGIISGNVRHSTDSGYFEAFNAARLLSGRWSTFVSNGWHGFLDSIIVRSDSSFKGICVIDHNPQGGTNVPAGSLYSRISGKIDGDSVKFRRTIPDRRWNGFYDDYSGTINSDGTMGGTFSEKGQGSYPWSASK